MLRRKAYSKLASWSKGHPDKALMLTGARQVGKTTLVREFAKSQYGHFAELNFLFDNDASRIFEGSLKANDIISNLTAYLQKPLEPGNTLILLDEIQECPRARTAIKSLVEDGRFAYVETGSLLGVRTKEVPSYPIGFEEPYRMYPLDFEEFCLANGVQQATIDTLRQHFQSCTPVSTSMHSTMMKLFQAYIVTGGMPEVVQRYVNTHDIAQVVDLQRSICALYRQDIAKYADNQEKSKIRAIFDALPSQLDGKNRRFVLADLNKAARQERYRSSFLWLADAGVTLPCYNVAAPIVPLEPNERHSLFKLFMNDVGLLCSSSLENVQLDVLQGNLDVNLGSIAENVVAQELKAHGFGLHYFNGKRQGEADFVVQSGKRIIPIEVKSGADWKRHKALDNIMGISEWDIKEAYVLGPGNVGRDDNITYLPLYMTMFLEPEKLPESLLFEVDLSALGNDAGHKMT